MPQKVTCFVQIKLLDSFGNDLPQSLQSSVAMLNTVFKCSK